MLPDRVSNPGPLTYESGVLPIALRGPAFFDVDSPLFQCFFKSCVPAGARSSSRKSRQNLHKV